MTSPTLTDQAAELSIAHPDWTSWDIAYALGKTNNLATANGSASASITGVLRARNITVSTSGDDTVTDGGLALHDEWRAHRRALRAEAKAAEPTPVYDVDTVDETAVGEQNKLLSAANGRLFKEVTRLRERNELLVQAVHQGAFDAMAAFGPYKQIVPISYAETRGRHSPEVALWHLTDWQGSKLTPSYNTDVMFERVRQFCQKAYIITEIGRADHPVTKCVIAFGGDMIEGLFNFPTQPFEIDQTIFGQLTSVCRLLVEVVQYALSIYDEVEVVAEWGNHGRIGSKRDNVPRHDNFDRICYEMARQQLRDQDRLTWEDCPEDMQRIEIGAYRALSIHGDEVGRGGYVSDGQMVNHVNRWKAGSYKWDFRDVYVGHYHQFKELPMANGEGAVYFTGSTESENRYAIIGLASSAAPTQRLHFIDQVKGRVTSQHKIYCASSDD